jgi:hypothetical protein
MMPGAYGSPERSDLVDGRAGGMPTPKRRGTRVRFLPLVALILTGLYAGGLALQWAFLRAQAVQDAQREAKRATELLALEIASTAPLQETLRELQDPERRKALGNLFQAKLAKFGLQTTKIYDLSGRIIYADEDGLVGETVEPIPEFQAALAGGIASRIVAPNSYEHRYGVPIGNTVVETYLPLEEGGEVRYVFEAYKDFEPVRERLARTVLLSGASLAVVVVLALGALMLSYRRIHSLQTQLETLESLLPICAYCKKIRIEDEGQPPRWVPVEQYFHQRDQVEFTHGICKECLQVHLAQYRKKTSP